MSGPFLDVNDVEIWANTKLQGDWSASGVVSQIDQPKLRMLGSVFSKGKLDQLVKVRLLIACMLLPKQRKAELAEELAQLGQVACNDDDEWVRVMACAVGDFSGQLNLKAVIAGNAMVEETVKNLWSQLDQAQAPEGFLPLQELYLHPDIRGRLSSRSEPRDEAQQQDFKPREGPEAAAALPDFSLDALLGGGASGPHAVSTATKAGAPSVHARRGTGLSGTGMFISSKSFGMPQKNASNNKLPGSTAGAASAAAATTAAAPDGPAPQALQSAGSEEVSLPRQPSLQQQLPAGFQRTSKAVALAVGEVAHLQRRGAAAINPGPGRVVVADLTSPRAPAPAAAAPASEPPSTLEAAAPAVPKPDQAAAEPPGSAAVAQPAAAAAALCHQPPAPQQLQPAMEPEMMSTDQITEWGFGMFSEAQAAHSEGLEGRAKVEDSDPAGLDAAGQAMKRQKREVAAIGEGDDVEEV